MPICLIFDLNLLSVSLHGLNPKMILTWSKRIESHDLVYVLTKYGDSNSVEIRRKVLRPTHISCDMFSGGGHNRITNLVTHYTIGPVFNYMVYNTIFTRLIDGAKLFRWVYHGLCAVQGVINAKGELGLHAVYYRGVATGGPSCSVSWLTGESCE